jgi:hypothetical protein
MRHIGTLLLTATLMIGCGQQTSQPKVPAEQPPPSETAKKNADAMRGLREMMLTTPATKFGIQKTDDFPRTYGGLMDWPISNGNIATVVGFCDGNASLYTTSTFGIIGGAGHESVRRAAASFVRMADKFYPDSTPTSEYSFPAENRVKFYLVTFDGVRVIDADLKSVSSGNDKFSELFGEGQKLLTKLRLTTEKKAE